MVPTVNRKKSALGDEYGTPEWVWKPWHEVLNFVIDAASSESNHLPFKKYWTRKDDSLRMPEGCWATAAAELGGSIWLNPPYSTKAGPIHTWVSKCLNEAAYGAKICALLPADTSTRWFDLVWDRHKAQAQPGCHLYFIQGRVRFIHPRTQKPTPQSPNFGSLIVVFSKT